MSIDAEHFIYYARLTDAAGNTTIIKSNEVLFDTKAPTIDGITDDETYYTSKKITTTDEHLELVVVNDEEVPAEYLLPGNVNKTYTIVAVDEAGNTTTITVSMKPISDLSDGLNGIAEDNVKPESKEKIEDIKKKAEAIDTTDATAEEKEGLQKLIDMCNSLLEKIEQSKAPLTSTTSNTPLWLTLLFTISGAILVLSVGKSRLEELKDK